MSTKRRPRSASASAQSDQSLRCAFSGYLSTQEIFKRTAKTLIRLDPQAVLLVLSCSCSYDSPKLLQFQCCYPEEQMSHSMTKPTKWPLRTTSASSDQSLQYAHMKKLPIERTAHSEDWSDWADAQADMSLRWTHRSFCWFCRAAAQIWICDSDNILLVYAGRSASSAYNRLFDVIVFCCCFFFFFFFVFFFFIYPSSCVFYLSCLSPISMEVCIIADCTIKKQLNPCIKFKSTMSHWSVIQHMHRKHHTGFEIKRIGFEKMADFDGGRFRKCIFSY